MYTLGQAEQATGKRKSTIVNAIKKGRISAKKNDSGEWQIDPAELHRVYKPVSSDSTKNNKSNDIAPHETPSELIELRVQVQALREQNSLLKDERNDLRRRLDTESEERRKLTMMLTDQREKSSQKPPEGPLTVWQWLRLAKR